MFHTYIHTYFIRPKWAFQNLLQYNMGFGEPHLQLAVVGRGDVMERFWDAF